LRCIVVHMGMLRVCLIAALALTAQAGFLQKEPFSFLQHDNAGDAHGLFADESEDMDDDMDDSELGGDAELDIEALSEMKTEDGNSTEIASDIEDAGVDMADISNKACVEADSAEASLLADFAKGGSDLFEKTTGINVCRRCVEKLWLKQYPRVRKCMKRCMKGAKTKEQAKARHPQCNRKCGGRAAKRVRKQTRVHCKKECTIRRRVKPPPACQKCIQKQWKPKVPAFRKCMKGCKDGRRGGGRGQRCQRECVQQARAMMDGWTRGKCKAECPRIKNNFLLSTHVQLVEGGDFEQEALNAADAEDEEDDESEEDEDEEEEEDGEDEATASLDAPKMMDAALDDISDKIADQADDTAFTRGLTSQQSRTRAISDEAADGAFTRGLISAQGSDSSDKLKQKAADKLKQKAADKLKQKAACRDCMKALWTKEVPAMRACMKLLEDKGEKPQEVKKTCGAEARTRVRSSSTQCKSQCAIHQDGKKSLLSMHAEIVNEEERLEIERLEQEALEAAA